MKFNDDFKMLIDGEMRAAAETLPVVNPANGQAFAHCPRGGEQDLNAAVAAAKKAQREWRKVPVEQRKALVVAAANKIMAHADELAALFSREHGRPLVGAKEEIMGGAFWMMGAAALDLPVEIVEETDQRRVEVRHEPLGVVGGIVPWNFPILLACWKIGPAVLTGNTVVLKPSPFTPLTTLKIGELLQDAFPRGVLNIVCGGDELGPMLTAHPDIAKISFTGSTATGKRVMESAAKDLKRITLELGGNDAAIVMPDVNVAKVAQRIFMGAFMNSAQVCVATKRLYVHDAIYDALRDKLHEIAKATKVGDAADETVMFGPIQNAMQYKRVSTLLDEARREGLTLLHGADVPNQGYFIPFTIVDNPPENARVVCEEAFGPILPMMRFTDVDDVIERANNSEYGLAGSVWSADLAKAVEIAGRLETGTVWINGNLESSPNIPLSGAKHSGLGVENGVDGLKEFTQSKTIFIPKTAEAAL